MVFGDSYSATGYDPSIGMSPTIGQNLTVRPVAVATDETALTFLQTTTGGLGIHAPSHQYLYCLLNVPPGQYGRNIWASQRALRSAPSTSRSSARQLTTISSMAARCLL